MANDSEAQKMSFAEKQKEVNSERISDSAYDKISSNTYGSGGTTVLESVDAIKSKVSILKEYENLLCIDAQKSIDIPSGVYKPKELISLLVP